MVDSGTHTNQLLIRSSWDPKSLYKLAQSCGLAVIGAKPCGHGICLLTFQKSMSPQAIEMVQRAANPLVTDEDEEQYLNENAEIKKKHRKRKHPYRKPKNLQ
jgi:hypothetical protein